MHGTIKVMIPTAMQYMYVDGLSFTAESVESVTDSWPKPPAIYNRKSYMQVDQWGAVTYHYVYYSGDSAGDVSHAVNIAGRHPAPYMTKHPDPPLRQLRPAFPARVKDPDWLQQMSKDMLGEEGIPAYRPPKRKPWDLLTDKHLFDDGPTWEDIEDYIAEKFDVSTTSNLYHEAKPMSFSFKPMIQPNPKTIMTMDLPCDQQQVKFDWEYEKGDWETI